MIAPMSYDDQRVNKLRRQRRTRSRRALSIPTVLAVLPGLVLVPLGPAQQAAAAIDTTYLDVGFGGNFNVGNAYTSATGETMGGTLERRNGAESLEPGAGILLGGADQGLSFSPDGVALGTSTLDQGFVMETIFTPGSSQGELATLLAVGGNLSVRYQNGKLRYGFDSQSGGTWTSHIKEIEVPAPDSEHIFSLAYLPSGPASGGGTSVIAYLDGTQLPGIETTDARAALSGSAVAPIGFGNDVHPQALQRGVAASLRGARWATATGPFDPAMFGYQQVSFVASPLKVSFSGTLDGTDYTPGIGENAVGGLTVNGGQLPQPGRLDLSGPDSGITWEATPLGDAGVAQPLIGEVLVAPELLSGGGTLLDLLGAVRVETAGPGTVRLVAGDADLELTLPEPSVSNGIEFYWLTVATDLDATGAGTVEVLAGGQPLADPVSVTGAAATGNEVAVGTAATGSLYGAAVSTGGTAADAVLGDLPCTASTLEPALRFAVTSGECAASVLSKASAVRPAPRQVSWQEAEQTAFLHFGMNTFTGNEWGSGDEDPNLFAPTDLDTDQWARTLRDNGFRYAILTVKHHDGFVLYPSRYTDHDVASSGWAGGEGDVLRQFTDSAHRYGLKVGLYLSPADWNQYRKGVFANGSAKTDRTIPTLQPGDDRAGQDLPSFTYRATDYGAYFLNQLYETLTEYGPVDEVWFDGADGGIPGAAAEQYDFAAWYDLIRHLQPQATIAVSGPDVRWVGNESGLARENESSVVAVQQSANGSQGTVPGGQSPDLGSDQVLAAAPGAGATAITWWPSEVDVSIRQGWFYHPDQAPKSVAQLRDIYYQSVGRNSVLLLNIPPDTDGALPAADVTRLGEWTDRLRQDMPADLALGQPVTVSDSGRSDPVALTDGDLRTAWVTSGSDTGSAIVELGAPTEVDRLVLGEDIADGGQQVTGFAVDARSADGSWNQVASSGTIGYHKILTLTGVTTDALRLRITDSRGPVHLAGLSAYRSAADPVPARDRYYLDCSAATAGDGSADRPMNSLGQLRAVNLPAGSQVLIKAGTNCSGTLELWGYGTDAEPAVLGRYGDGPAPVIEDPDLATTLERLSAQGWRIDLQAADPVETTTTLRPDRPVQGPGGTPGVTLTATVSAAADAPDDIGPVAGTVVFRAGDNVLGSEPVGARGTAEFRLPAATPAGRLEIVADFVPDDAAAFAPSSSKSVKVIVRPAG